MKKKRLILASSSIYRKILLSSIRANFECISPNIDETRKPNEKAQEMVKRLSIEKAGKVGEKNKNSIIIASDTCAYCDSTILGKPLKKDIAIEYLNFISGKKIFFYTGLCVLDADMMKFETEIAKYEIKIKKLKQKDILDYIEIHNPLNSSAAFRYEVAKDFLIEEFEDSEKDLSGLIGLPLVKLQKILDSWNLFVVNQKTF